MADTVTVRVPLAIRKRGGRKVVVSPDGSVLPTAPQHVATNADPALLKALGRASRWKRLLDDGTYASVSDIARAEKLDRTYVGDILRLTLLAPWVVEAIVEGRHPAEMTLPGMMKEVPIEWEAQRAVFEISARCADAASADSNRVHADPALLKALGRAFRWKRLLDEGAYASVSDIARAEKLDRTYVGDVLRLTLLAPEIVEAIVGGRQDDRVSLPVLIKGVAMKWETQRIALAAPGCDVW
jgi:hypothetical protein